MTIALTADITARQAYIPVTNGLTAVVGQAYQIDTEYLVVLQARATNLHVVRGAYNSVPAAHLDDEVLTAVNVVAVTTAPADPPGGGGGDLETTLTLGNETGEHTIEMPIGTLDGTTGTGALTLEAAGAGGVEGGTLQLGVAAAATASGTAQLASGDFSDNVGPYGANVTLGNALAASGGAAQLVAGPSADAVGNGGAYFQALGGTDTAPGDAVVGAGDAGTGSGKAGGDINLTPGSGDGGGRHGQVILGGQLTTGEHTIEMPLGNIDGRTDQTVLTVRAEDGAGVGLRLLAGSGSAGVAGGLVTVAGGYGNDGATLPAQLFMYGGDATISSGQVTLVAGQGGPALSGGNVSISGGRGDGGTVGAGRANFAGGNGTGLPGDVEIAGGDASVGSGQHGGDVTLAPGAGDGAGRNGLIFPNLPTSDPGVVGAMWVDAVTHIVKVSA